MRPVQELYRMQLRLEYTISQYEALIKKDPVRFSRIQVPLRDSRVNYEKIGLILNKHSENPQAEDEKLRLKQQIISNEVRRLEGGLCMSCTYYLPNRLKGEYGYTGMLNKLKTLPEDVIACKSANLRLPEPTRTACEMYVEDQSALRDDDLKELDDRIAAWLALQAKYDAPMPARIDKAPIEPTAPKNQ